jgi:hypothetical protein
MIFAYGASCFVPVDKFNLYCDKPGGMIGRVNCTGGNGQAMHGGQFVITKREMDNLIKKECKGHTCNIKHIELALGIICDSTDKGPWEGVGLVRVDIPEANYLPSGITWPTVKDCGSDNPCFRPGGEHKTSGGLVEGFMKPVSTAKCMFDKNNLYSK